MLAEVAKVEHTTHGAYPYVFTQILEPKSPAVARDTKPAIVRAA